MSILQILEWARHQHVFLAIFETCSRVEPLGGRIRSIHLKVQGFQPGAGQRPWEGLQHFTRNPTAADGWSYEKLIEKPVQPAKFQQALVNLIVNAAHAIEDKVEGTEERGRITLSTFQRGERVVIEVSDTGCGIDPEIAERIFDPFFTTKEVGKGTGQGLAIAHSLIREKHQGDLEYETEVGVGTTFRIILPVRQEIAA